MADGVNLSLPRGTPIVFVHGLGGTPEVWHPIVERLGAPADVLNIEMPWSGRQGSGWSARPAAEWIRTALVQVRRPACVVAHSFGANAVLEYLDAHGAAAIDRLALVCPFYDSAGLGLMPEERFSLENFARLVEDGFRRQPQARQVPSHIYAAMAQRVRDRVGLEGWREFQRVFARTSTLRLRRFSPPCLLLAGDNDHAAPPADVVALGQVMSNCTVVGLPDCGHFAITEQPRQIAGYLNRLLALSERSVLCAAS
jgi:pimeloyl-ACP methyl ester carboxylesterase